MATKKPAYSPKPGDALDFDSMMAALAQPATDAAPQDGAMRRYVGDTALSVGRGAVQGVRMLTDIAGADNAVSGGLRSVEDFIGGLQSATAKRDQAEIARLLAEAEGKGVLDQVVAGLKAFGTAPLQTMAQAAGTSLPTIAAALIPGAGPVAMATRFAAPLALGAAQGAGAVKSSIYDEVKQRALKERRTPAEAEQLAAQAQSYGGDNAGQIALGAGLGAWAGKSGLEGAAQRLIHGGGGQAASGMASRVAMGALAEGIPEAAQGGQEKFASNSALNNAGFPTDPMSGVIANATMEGLAGHAMGGAMGIPRPGDAIRATKVPEGGPMTRAANAATEAQARAADAGMAPPPTMTAEQEAKALQGIEAQGAADQKAQRKFGSQPTMAGRAAQAQQPGQPADVGSAEVIDSPFSDRVLTLREQLSDENTRAQLRAQFGDEALSQATYYAGIADRADVQMPPATRERLLQVAERMVSDAVLKPITAPTELPNEGGAAPAELAGPAGTAPQIGLDTGLTGTLRADARGNVAPETNADAIDTRNAAARTTDEPQGRRASAVYGENNPAPPAPPAIEYDTKPTGRMVAGKDGVRAETGVDRIEAGKAQGEYRAAQQRDADIGLTPDVRAAQERRNAPRAQPGDVLNPKGEPFKTELAANRAQKKAGTGAVLQVAGGWVVRPGATTVEPSNAQDQATRVPPAAAPAPVQEGADSAGPGTPAAPAAGAAGPTGAPAPAVEGAGLTTKQSSQFADYKYAIEQADTVGGGTLDQIRADERLEDGEAEQLLALAQPKARAGKAEAGQRKPPFVSKEDGEHLFGIPQKRAKALERIAKGSAYFGAKDKANDFITGNGLKETHEAFEAKPGRFEVRAKGSQQAAPENAISRRNRLKAERATAAAPAPAAPAVVPRATGTGVEADGVKQPDRVKVMTRQGQNVYVERADLESDKPRMRHFTSTGKSLGLIVRENLDPTGELRRADAKEAAENPLFDAIGTKDGRVFASEAAAARELSQRGLKDTHEVAPEGNGFIVKRRAPEAAPQPTGGEAAPAPAPEAAPVELPRLPVDAYRVERRYANGAVIRPLPGKTFADGEVQQIADWFRAAKWEVSTAAPSGVSAVNNANMSADDIPEPYTAAQRKKDERRRDADAATAAKTAAQDDYLTGTAAGEYVAATFGDTLNKFNSVALAKFLAGEASTFEGLMNARAADVVQGMGIAVAGRATKDVLADLKARFAGQAAPTPERTPKAQGVAKQAQPQVTRFVTKSDMVGSTVEWQEQQASGDWMRLTTFDTMQQAKDAAASRGYDAEAIPRFVSEFSASAKRFLQAVPEAAPAERTPKAQAVKEALAGRKADATALADAWTAMTPEARASSLQAADVDLNTPTGRASVEAKRLAAMPWQSLPDALRAKLAPIVALRVPKDAQPAAAATHKDPGEPAEPVTPAVVREAIKTGVKDTGRKPSEMKAELLAKIDAAVQEAPDYGDFQAAIKTMGLKEATEAFTGRAGLGEKAAPQGYSRPTRMFHVKGDGIFTIQNTVRQLLTFRAKVESSPGFKDRQAPGGLNERATDALDRRSTDAAIANMVDEGDFQAALDFAEAKDVDIANVKLTKVLRDRLDKWQADQESARRMAEYKAAQEAGKPAPGSLAAAFAEKARDGAATDGDMRGYAWALVKDGKVIRSGSLPKPEFAPASDDTKLSYYKDMADKAGADLHIVGYPGAASWEPTEGLIFGMTWAELNARQQKNGQAGKAPDGKMPKDAVLAYSPAAEPEAEDIPEAGIASQTFDQWVRAKYNGNEYKAKYLEEFNGDEKRAILGAAAGTIDNDQTTAVLLKTAKQEYRSELFKLPRETSISLDVWDDLSDMLKVEAQRHFFDLDRRITRRDQDTYAAKAKAEREKKAPYEAAFAEVDAEIRRLDKIPGPETQKQKDLSGRRDRLREAIYQIGQGKEPDGRLLRKEEDPAAPAAASAMTGPRRDPEKVSMFNPYLSGDIVTIGGKDWMLKQDMPGWYLTSDGTWRGEHPTIRGIKAMQDLIREVEQAAQDAAPAVAPAAPAEQAAAILNAAAEPPNGRERLDVLKDVKAGAITPEEVAAAFPPAPITDVGEKIGGARKDMAESGGTRSKRGTTDDRPAWARRFEISQIVTPGGMVGEVKDAGRWIIRDSRSLDWMKQPKQVGRSTYATKEEAEASVPLAAVSLKHRTIAARDGKYEIWRNINDRKRVKVVDQQFDSREEAMAYMMANAVQIVETNTTFGEADMPLPPDRARAGPQRRTGNVNGQDFKDTFGLRGVEFGNWNNQDERQSLMNDAWDGLMDLAEVLNVPARALGMNGDLALAFGARGHGLNSARAHYEPARAVINLTKESGAGSLAHEWFHALDHYFGRQDGKASAEWKMGEDGTRTLAVQGDGAEMVSTGFRGERSGVRPKLREAYEAMLRTMTKKAETYVEDTAKADKFTGVAREELAEALASLRRGLAEQLDVRYWKRNNKPATAEQLAEFDAIAKQMLDGEVTALATDWKTFLKGGDKPANARGASIATRWTNDSLERLSAIHKEVRGRNGFDGTNKQGVMDRLRGNMERYSQRLKMLADAQGEVGKVRAVPTDFAMNARELDQGRGTDYWTTPHEMAARAFQGYVEDKIAERGGMSRFLNYAPENAAILTPWGFKRPYPAGEERKAINDALDKFISALETRADDAGNVAMFSRAEAQQQPASDRRQAVEALVQQIASRWGNAPVVVVVDSMEDERVPKAVRDYEKAQQSKGASGAPEGFFFGGKVYLVAGQLGGDADVLRVLFHEFGHAGLRTLFGPQLSTILTRLAVLNASKVRSKAAQYGLDYDKPADRRAAAEEVLAEMAERNPTNGWVKQAVAAIRSFLRAHVPGFSKMRLSDAELVRTFVRPALDYVAGNPAMPVKTNRAQFLVDKGGADAKPFADGGIAEVLVEQGAQALNIDQRLEVMARVFGALQDLKVFEAVVGLDSVDVVNDIIDAKLTASGGRDNHAMLLERLAVKLNGPIADQVKVIDALFPAVQRAAKKLAPAEAGADGFFGVISAATTGAYKQLAADAAGKLNGRHVVTPTSDGLLGDGVASTASSPPSVSADAVEKDSAAFSRSIGDAVRDFADKFNKGPAIVGQTGRQYTPAQLAAMTNVGFQTEPQTIQERAKSLWAGAGKSLAQGLVDQFAPVKAISEKAYGLLRLSKGASGAFEALLQGGKLKISDGVYDFDATQRGGVVDTLFKPLNGEHHDFLRWVAANRADRLMGVGKENLFSPEDIVSLKSLADGSTDFDYTIQHGAKAGQVTRSRSVIYADSLKTFNAFSANVLDMAEQSGLIDGEARGLWENEFYVPFYRVEEDGNIAGANIKNGAVRQQAFRSLTGRKNKLNADLLDNTLMNWAHLLDAGAKNRAAKASIEAAEKMGAAELVDGPSGKGTVWFRENGEKRYSFVSDPHLLTAISALEYAGMRNPVMNAMGAFKRALTIGVTASPFFKIRNLIRDSVQAIGTGNLSYNIAANVAQGWKLTDPAGDSHFRLLAGGGTIHFGTMMEGNEAKRVQALVESGVDAAHILDSDHKVKAFYRKFIEPGITAYNELGNRGEEINRASLYDQLMKQGMSHAEASLQARDLMDFSMQGSFTSIRFLTQVVPFLNARIQGLYKLGRAAKEDPARFSAVLGAVTLMSLALLAAYSDDDDWKKREDWDRNNFWWFKIAGTAVRIPKPFEIGAIATLAERGFELAFDKEMTGARFRKQVLTLLGDNLSMNPIPQLVKPILDVYANKNSFTGRPIETMGMEKLKPAYRVTERTTMAAKGISAAANVVTGLVGAEAYSPVQVDSLLQGYFGWLGSFIVGGGDVVARIVSDQPAKATPDYWKAATGGIISSLQDAPSRYVSQMYEQASEVEKAYGTWQMLRKQGRTDEAAEFQAENKDDINRHRELSRVKQTETRLNARIRSIQMSDRPADEKRDLIRSIQSQKDQIARALAPAG